MILIKEQCLYTILYGDHKSIHSSRNIPFMMGSDGTNWVFINDNILFTSNKKSV